MLHTTRQRSFDQRAALGGVVVIIFERVLDRLGHDDRSGEVHDRPGALFGEYPREQIAVCDIAFVKLHSIRHSEPESG